MEGILVRPGSDLPSPAPRSRVADDRAGPPRARSWTLSAGVVAHNEERTVEAAVRSLLEQELPDGACWRRVWVVASGCTDSTADIVARLAAEDPRIGLVVEPSRLGKAQALREVFARATGNALVLLNGDARADPDAVARLLRTAETVPEGRPWAVMGRPFPRPALRAGRWTSMLALLWDLHHEFHAQLAREGGGAHLSDELLLLGLPIAFDLPTGTINDGSYLGVWLAQKGGARCYASDARVVTEAPPTARDHLAQRRRIRFGNLQVRRLLGAPTTTIVGRGLEDPLWTLRLFRAATRGRSRGSRDLVALTAFELAAYVLAAWDRLAGSSDHVRWVRIRSAGGPAPEPADPVPQAPSAPVVSSRVHRRIGLLTSLASSFGTSVPVEDLVQLLPTEGPRDPTELEQWLAHHPDACVLESGRVTVRGARTASLEERRARGRAYLDLAAVMAGGPLRRAHGWLRCIAVSGSTAYGEPEPGDDLDFFVVTRRGAVWWFLAYAFLQARLVRWRNRGAYDPSLCFNYVQDETDARREFAREQGLLFAREALTLRCVWGEEYYRSLLVLAPWMSDAFPRLHAERTGGPATPPQEPAPAPVLVRILNALVFPGLAAYLQLTGLRRNARLRSTGATARGFRTQSTPRRLQLRSERFEEIRRRYDRYDRPGPDPHRAPAAEATPSSP